MNLRMYISYDIALNMCIYLYYKNAKMNVKDNPIFQMLHNGSDCLYQLKCSVGYIWYSSILSIKLYVPSGAHVCFINGLGSFLFVCFVFDIIQHFWMLRPGSQGKAKHL